MPISPKSLNQMPCALFLLTSTDPFCSLSSSAFWTIFSQTFFAFSEHSLYISLINFSSSLPSLLISPRVPFSVISYFFFTPFFLMDSSSNFEATVKGQGWSGRSESYRHNVVSPIAFYCSILYDSWHFKNWQKM